MLYLKLLLTLASLFAVFHVFKFRKESKLILNLITLAMVIGVFIAISVTDSIRHIGIYIYLAAVIMAFVYGLLASHLKMTARVIVCLMSVFILVYWIWVLNHFHGNEHILPYLVVMVGIYGFQTKANLKHEIGILVILSADAIALIVENWMK